MKTKKIFSLYSKQSAVGLELWSMSSNILFDNLLITDDVVVAEEWAEVTFGLKRKQLDLESVSNHFQSRR